MEHLQICAPLLTKQRTLSLQLPEKKSGVSHAQWEQEILPPQGPVRCVRGPALRVSTMDLSGPLWINP
jgi:hypothetical protein